MMTVEDSLDGKTWRPFHLLGPVLTFKSKAAAKRWFTSLIEANTPDWQVGFMVHFTNGRYYRLVHKNGKEVRYS